MRQGRKETDSRHTAGWLSSWASGAHTYRGLTVQNMPQSYPITPHLPILWTNHILFFFFFSGSNHILKTTAAPKAESHVCLV